MQQTNRPMSEAEMSENCCVLNVWTTGRNARKPVMLWLHGGGFDSGTSAWDPGMCLTRKDVVVVGINHRLNILGFLDLFPCGEKYKYSGNVGMLDCVAALQWVHDNIAQFGGDPQNVTIFGESGGGGKVGTQSHHHERYDSQCQHEGDDRRTGHGCAEGTGHRQEGC